MNIQSMDKRAQILATITEIIASEGVTGSPMSQLAKKSGVATGTIYHHFKSKEDIINEVYISIKKNFKVIIEEVKAKQLDFEEEFKGVWLGFYHYFANHPTQFKFIQQVDHSPIITPETHTTCEKYLHPVFEFYQKGIDENILIDMDIMLIGHLTYDNIFTMVNLKLKGFQITQRILQQAVDFSWRGIAKE